MRTFPNPVLLLAIACCGMVFLACAAEAPGSGDSNGETGTAIPDHVRSYGFRGHARDGIDRVRIRIDPQVPADVGGDFTIEFWLKMQPGDNPGGSADTNAGDGTGWIYGHIVLDRDIDDSHGSNDNGDFGISLAGGRPAFGVAKQLSGKTIHAVGAPDLRDGQWHHLAFTRRATDGLIRIFVDGSPAAEGTGPAGDISYLDGRTPSSRLSSDPFLVLGAEKHDYAGVLGYRGLLSGLRISTAIRYTTAFTIPRAPYTVDTATAALYLFNSWDGTNLVDHAGGGSPGEVRQGGEPAGPYPAADSPWETGD